MIKNFFNVAGADAVKRIAEWIRHKFYTKTQADDLLDDKVDKVSGKGLSTEDYTTAEKTKLGGIEAGAEVNVQSDWNQSDSTKDDFIKNKPTLRQPSADGTSGQYLKSNGSGNAPSWETMDTAPTANSTKAVTSGGVKTALDGKQASVTITTNANTPTDNDTVIMQDNGNTGTTSFLRRKLSTLWTYIKGKADGVYVPFAFVNIVGDGGSKNLWDNILDGKMWGADQRFNVTWVSYNIESGEVVETKDAKNLFNMADNYYKHPITGEKDIITISPKDGLSSSYLWTYCHGYYYLNFYSTKLPESATLRWKQRNSDTWNTATFETFGRGNQSWRALIPWGSPNVSTYVNTIEITIIGKTDSEVAWPGTSVCNLTHICTRETLGERGVVTKYAIAQNLYGNLTAPKFITRGGTTSQFVLGDGTLQNSPIPVSKGGTGATTAIGAEYNILNQVADISTTLSDTRKIALCNQTKSASNGVFRWIALSNVWTWIKTHFDSSPTSGSGNGITSGGVYSALEEKVNLQPDFTVSQIDYSAGNVGKWQKVLRFPEGADLVINMKKTAMGSDSTSTLWFSSSSMGDNYTSLFGNHSVRFVHDGGYVFLVLACRKSTYEPIESYTFQIAHSSVPMSDIVAVTEASPITATPKEPSIVYRAPITTGAVSFNVTNGAGSVAMANHNDFLGNMTSEATNGVTVTMSGATEGQIYRFVFTRNITGGVTFKQSNVAYCTISGDVNAGDTITLTAVSNTADGWLYEQESAGIKSTDGSVNVEYDGGVADLSINIPPDVVRNNVWTSSLGHRVLAIGDGADASGNFAVCVGGNSEASDGGSCAYGYQAKAGGVYSTAVGYQAKCEAYGGLSLGEFSRSIGYYSVAVGGSAKAGIPSTDTDRPRLSVKEFIAVQFSEGGNSKISEYVTTTDAVTITVNGNDYTLTPPAANRVLIVVYDSNAQYITEAVTGYAKVNGEDLYMVSDINIEKENLSGNYYALWLIVPSAYYPSNVTSLSILAYHKSANTTDYAHAIGYRSRVSSSNSVAMGNDLVSVTARQTVIGVNNIPDIDAFFVVGAGSTAANGRKNILTIDSKERLRVRSYVGETQTIEMSRQTGSLSNITKAVYRISWNDTGTVTLTLQASGCVEGQRVTIFAETNDVSVSGKLIVTGRYMDFVFIAGDWRAPQDPWQ